jgi:predicted ATP-dependent serine protease
MDKIKEYALKTYKSRFKSISEITVEERDNHYIVYAKDGSPVFLNKKRTDERIKAN